MSIYKKFYSILNSSERKMLIMLSLMILIAMILEVLGVGLVIPVINMLLKSESDLNNPWYQMFFKILGHPKKPELIIYTMILVLLVYFLKNLYLAYFAWIKLKTSRILKENLSRRLLKNYLNQPYSFFLNRNSAQLITNTSVAALNTGDTITIAVNLITEFLVFFGIAFIIFAVEPQGALAVLIILGICSWAYYTSQKKKLHILGKEKHQNYIRSLQHIQQSFGSIKEIQLFGREKEFLEKFTSYQSKYLHFDQRFLMVSQLPRLWLELLAVLGFVIITTVMVIFSYATSEIIAILALFAVAAFRVMPAIGRILVSMQYLKYSLGAFEAVFNDLKIQSTEKQKTGVSSQFNSEIIIKNINFVYPNSNKKILKDVSINIKKGESIGFVGTSGAGKTTLVDIILGLLTINSGEVKIDNIDIEQNIRGWQNQIGYVPQSIYITDDTLKRNIAFGLPDRDINDVFVKQAIKDAQLEKFTLNLTNGYDTELGEKGIRLSGGERQRIAIARALYHNPSVLVLDEATSSLDIDTEEEIMSVIKNFKGEKTIIIVSHRANAIKHCDKLYLIENGKLFRKEI